MTDGGLEGELYRLKEIAIEELQDTPRSASGIAVAFNEEERPAPITEQDMDEYLDADEVRPVLESLVNDGKLAHVEERDGWYKLADWDERPLRVQSVSHHVVRLDGVDQLEEIWLDESINAARYEHPIHDDRLQPMKWEEERSYIVSIYNHGVLEQYRETLYRLARDLRESNEKKAGVYESLADATDIEDQFDTRDEEVVLDG